MDTIVTTKWTQKWQYYGTAWKPVHLGNVHACGCL